MKYHTRHCKSNDTGLTNVGQLYKFAVANSATERTLVNALKTHDLMGVIGPMLLNSFLCQPTLD